MLQRVDQGIGSGSVSEWGPASSGVVRSAPVHTTAGIPALVILQYCHPKSCAVFLCSACANTAVYMGGHRIATWPMSHMSPAMFPHGPLTSAERNVARALAEWAGASCGQYCTGDTDV